MEWYPTPSYLVKRRVILEYLETFGFGKVLEVGCGCGDLLHVLGKKGYSGVGIDLSDHALDVARSGLGNSFNLFCGAPGSISGKFDIVIASEVMEHCQNDADFISELGERLHDRGCLILTVPAHMKDWGANDELSGHVRRYERNELLQLLENAGFEDVVIYSYGVPVYNIMKPFYDRAVCSKNSAAVDLEKTVESSGMHLLKEMGGFFRLLFNDLTMYPFYILQRLFYHTDLGKGYFIAARKKEQK